MRMERERGEMTGYVVILCSRFLIFCRYHGDSCEMWNQEDGLYRCNGHQNNCRIVVFVDDGIDYGDMDGHYTDQRENSFISCAFRTCDRGILAVLLPCTAAW